MRFDIITIFPEFFRGPLDYGIIRRAREAKLIDIAVHDLRDFAHDRHRTVDDRPFGGGEGMVLKPEPIFEAVESLVGVADDAQHAISREKAAIVLLSAAGEPFRQETARQFSKLERIVLICGRYEGVDERVAGHLATDEISIGDFVLSGGELAGAMVLDAVTRLIPGALGNEDSTENESFSPVALDDLVDLSRAREQIRDSSTVRDGGILDYPHYTRPQNFRSWGVPEVLVSGNHEEVRRWRKQMAVEKTRRQRPDLLMPRSLRAEE